jgi:hypothetical protein
MQSFRHISNIVYSRCFVLVSRSQISVIWAPAAGEWIVDMTLQHLYNCDSSCMSTTVAHEWQSQIKNHRIVPSPDCASARIESVESPTAQRIRLSPLIEEHYQRFKKILASADQTISKCTKSKHTFTAHGKSKVRVNLRVLRSINRARLSLLEIRPWKTVDEICFVFSCLVQWKNAVDSS